MQTHGGADAEAAITSGERRFFPRLLVDWDRDGEFAHRFSDMTRYASDIGVSRSLSGNLPEEINLIEGSAAAELTTTVGGYDEERDLPFAGVFSAYNGASVFYLQELTGCRVRYEIGVDTAAGIVWYPQFVGRIREVNPDRASNTVQFTALDDVEDLRIPVQYPPWAMSNYWEVRARREAQWTETQWVIDNALRLAGYSPTPWRPSTRDDHGAALTDISPCQFFLTGTGSIVPTIGWCDHDDRNEYPLTGTPMYIPNGQVHPDSPEPDTRPLLMRGTGSDASDRKQYWAADRDHMTRNGVNVFDLTLDLTGPTGYSYLRYAPEFYLGWFRLEGHFHVGIKIANGRIWTVMESLSDGDLYGDGSIPDGRYRLTVPALDLPSNADSVDVHVFWDYQHVGYISLSTGGVSRQQFANTPVGTLDLLQGLIQLNNRVGLSDVAWFYRFVAVSPESSTEFARRRAEGCAVLDRGLNRFSYMPIRKVDDAWTVVTDAASAEFGAAFFDEAGVFRFWNYDRIMAKQDTPVRTLTLDDISNLPMTQSYDSVRNIWTVTTAKKRSGRGTAYKAKDPEEFFTPSVTNTYFRFWLDDVMCPNAYKASRCYIAESANYRNPPPYPLWYAWESETTMEGYVVEWWNSASDHLGWRERESLISGVDLTGFLDSNGYVSIKLWNGYGYDTRLAGETNARGDQHGPTFHLGGSVIYEYDGSTFYTEDRDSIATYGSRHLKLESDYYQDLFVDTGVIDKLMARTTKPIPRTDAVTMAGDPRLQIGDTVSVRDPAGIGEATRLQILGISRSYSLDEGLTDSLDVEMIEPTGIGRWDSPQYGLWDQTFTWSP